MWILHHLSHQGSPKNSGMGSHSFLQWIFLNQESNRGVLHCRQILCQLSYQGSPYKWEEWYKSHDFQRHPWQATHQVSLTCLAKSDKLSFACLTTLVLSAQGIFKSLCWVLTVLTSSLTEGPSLGGVCLLSRAAGTSVLCLPGRSRLRPFSSGCLPLGVTQGTRENIFFFFFWWGSHASFQIQLNFLSSQVSW